MIGNQIPTRYEHKFCQGWEGKPSGQEKNPVEKVYKGLQLNYFYQ